MKNRIRQVRKKLNMTQDVFGNGIGLRRNTITAYETGLKNPFDLAIKAMCREYGINEEWLRTGKGTTFSNDEATRSFEMQRLSEMYVFCQRIRERRIELGLSADQLAEQLGKSRATVYRYENGDIDNIPLSILPILAKTLRVSLPYLMGWSEEKNVNNDTANQPDIRKRLADNLRMFRLRSGLTVKEIGEMIGKTDKTVSGWEHGRGQPDAYILYTLSKLYNVESISAFYGIKDKLLSISNEEVELIGCFRTLNAVGKDLLFRTAKAFAGNLDTAK